MLFYLLLALAAAGEVCLYLCVPGLHPALILPLYLGGVIALNLLYLLLLLLSTLFLPRKAARGESRFCRFMIRVTADWILAWFGVGFRLEGGELLPDEPMVLVCNHRSMFDPIVTVCALRGIPISFISKLANMKIPILGPYARRCSYLGIDRESPLSALRTIRRAGDTVKEKGISFGIYPEGTRTKDGLLHPFKEGAFVAARRAEAPIVIAVIEGTERVHHRPHPFRRVRVLLRVVAVIPREEVDAFSPRALALRAEVEIAAALGEPAPSKQAVPAPATAAEQAE